MERKIIRGLDEVKQYISKLGYPLAVDIETTSLSLSKLKLRGISYCDGTLNLYVDLDNNNEHNSIINFLKDYYKQDSGKIIIMHNASFDLTGLSKFGIDLSEYRVWDTATGDHLLDENRTHKLKDIAERELGVKTKSFDEANVDYDTFCEYALNDSLWTYQIYQKQIIALQKEDLLFLMEKIEMPYNHVLAQMRQTGMLVDWKLNKELMNKAEDHLINLELELYSILGEKCSKQFNLIDDKIVVKGKYKFTSNDHISEIITSKLNLTLTETTATGKPKVDKRILNNMKGEHKFIDKLLHFRKMIKLYNAFLSPLNDFREDDDTIRPNFINWGTRTGRLSSGKPNCLSEDTEVLTKNRGWVEGKYATLNDEIATYNENKGIIEFQYPLRLISGYADFGWHISNQHIDMICTDNHRHLLFNRKNNKRIVTEGQAFISDHKFLNASIYDNNKADDWLQRIVCVIQADGHITNNRIDFGFSKKRKYDRLKELLDGFNYIDASNSKRYRIYWKPDDIIWKDIDTYMERDTKTFKPNIVDKFGKAFFEELRCWDGLYTREFGERYCSMNKTNVDLVQAVCTLQGYRSIISPDNLRVSVTNRNYSLTTNVITQKTGGFKFWCATMANDTLLVRRKGKVWITKNCQQFPSTKDEDEFQIRKQFIAPSGYKMIATDYSGQELRVMALISKDMKMIEAIAGGDDLHQKTADLMGVERKDAKCFGLETEVLTRSGWRKIIDIDIDTEIAQAVPKNKFGAGIEWIKPTEIFTKEDELLHLYNEGIDLKVTPDHRMLAYRNDGTYYVTTPLEFNKVRYWKNAGIMWNKEYSNPFDTKLIKLIVATQADGSYNGNKIRFGFTKQRKIKRLLSILDENDYNISHWKGGVTSISLNEELSNNIKQYLDNKKFKYDLLNMHPFARKTFIDELVFWDGHTRDNWRMIRYTSGIEQNIEVVQAMAALTGRKSRKVKKANGYYDITIRENNKSRGENITIKSLGRQKVVCLSVPSTFVLVRDGGVPIITGQSINFGVAYGKESYGFSKDFGISEDEAQKILDRFFNAYPDLKRSIEDTHKQVISQGWVSTPTKRKRRFKMNENYVDKKALRQSFNFKIQSLSADMIRIASNKVYKLGKKNPEWGLKQVATVHDENVYIIKEQYVNEALPRIEKQFTNAIKSKLVFEVESGVGDNYQEAK